MSDPRVLFRCDGGAVPEIGTGHVRRCLLLAERLRTTVGAESHFLMQIPAGIEFVRRRNFQVRTFTGDEAAAVEAAVRDLRPRLVVFDELDTQARVLIAARSAGDAVVATLDDRGAAALADLWINGILEVPGATYRGPDYVVLPPLDTPVQQRATSRDALTAFLSFGGHDHHKLAQRSLEVVARTPGIRRVIVAVAATDANLQTEGLPVDVEVHVETPRFGELLRESDLAIVAGGLTLFEAMRSGIPAIVVAQYPHQVETAARYQDRGAARSVGLAGLGWEARLRAVLEDVVGDAPAREAMAIRGRALVDGRGLERVASLLSRPLARPP